MPINVRPITGNYLQHNTEAGYGKGLFPLTYLAEMFPSISSDMLMANHYAITRECERLVSEGLALAEYSPGNDCWHGRYYWLGA